MFVCMCVNIYVYVYKTEELFGCVDLYANVILCYIRASLRVNVILLVVIEMTVRGM